MVITLDLKIMEINIICKALISRILKTTNFQMTSLIQSNLKSIHLSKNNSKRKLSIIITLTILSVASSHHSTVIKVIPLLIVRIKTPTNNLPQIPQILLIISLNSNQMATTIY